MSPPRGVLALGLGGAVLVACQLFVAVDYPEPPPRAAISPDAGDPCRHASPPPKPDGGDDTTSDADSWFAIEHLTVPLGPDAGDKPGFDLDHSCTCAADAFDGGPSCDTPGAGGSHVACDFDGGVDDSLAVVTGKLTLPNVDFADVVNRNIRNGLHTALLYLGGYNGKPDDPLVHVSLVDTTGLFSNLGCNDVPRPGVSEQDGAATNPPLWDGCDHWSPKKGQVVAANLGGKVRPPTLTVTGYVSQGYVVAEFDQIALGVLGASARVFSAVSMAKIIPDGSSFRLEGVIAGRLPFGDIVELLGSPEIDDLTGDGGRIPFCKSPYWAQVSPVLCAARDVMDQPSLDRQGKTCNATSAAIGFSARPCLLDDNEYDMAPEGVTCGATIDCP